MPQRKFRMFLSSKNTQTTAYHRFHATRQTDPNFVMNAGCCGNRNPLIGWRKEQTCCLNCCIRTQRVEGEWSGGQPEDATGFVFTQDTTNVQGTLIEVGPDYGIFQMADCESVFVTGQIIRGGPPGGLGGDFRGRQCPHPHRHPRFMPIRGRWNT